MSPATSVTLSAVSSVVPADTLDATGASFTGVHVHGDEAGVGVAEVVGDLEAEAVGAVVVGGRRVGEVRRRAGRRCRARRPAR